MDGFGTNAGVIILAATNRADILDKALLRAGRFDRQIHVDLPDLTERKAIFNVHTKKLKFDEKDVDIEFLSKQTPGFSGADIANVCNEAALIAARKDKKIIEKQDFLDAVDRIIGGLEKKNKIITPKEKRTIAYHEAGHAILFHVLPDVGPVYTVSIIPTGTGAAGYTMPLPEKDEMFNTKGRMLQDIMVSLGGRIAEEIIFDDITTGASSDIKKATKVARAMVTRFGMSENIGVINYDENDNEVFIGRDLAHTRSHSEAVAGAIDAEVKSIIDDCYKKAKDILDPNVKYKEENGSVFSNIVIEFVTARDTPLTIGQKISGRYGNKGVVSKILPDDEMPYDENGRRVDVILNSLGVINRLNSFQLYEQSINFINTMVVKRLSEMTNKKEKEELLFDIVGRFNKTEAQSLRDYYKKLSAKEKNEFFEDIQKDGIYIHIPPLWEDEPIYNKIHDIYKDYDWIKPPAMYVNKFGRQIKIMKPIISGEIYMIKLKQSSKKNFSARSTGALSKKGIPERSNRNKNHQLK